MHDPHDTITIRPLHCSDAPAIKAAMLLAYPRMQAYWPREQLEQLVRLFPEGQLVLTVNGRLAGAALSLRVDHARWSGAHTFRQVTGAFTFSTHTPGGDALYGIEVFVAPAFRGRGLARRLYAARRQLCRRLNLRGIVFGARLAGYHRYQAQLTPSQYVRLVTAGRLQDATLSFQLAGGFRPVQLLPAYLPNDVAAGANALLMRWDNPHFQPPATAQLLSAPDPRQPQQPFPDAVVHAAAA
jgi:GNAT superfamily N-acetyltransferase